jgi:hypothetical protein
LRVVEPGHIYEVHNVDGPGVQRIIFVRRRGDDGRMLKIDERHKGILAQELMRVLIDRTLYLNAEAPCVEDIEAINLLRRCLMLFESRAARRTIEKLPMPEMTDVCARCHHILCRCDEPSRLEHGIER